MSLAAETTRLLVAGSFWLLSLHSGPVQQAAARAPHPGPGSREGIPVTDFAVSSSVTSSMECHVQEACLSLTNLGVSC